MKQSPTQRTDPRLSRGSRSWLVITLLLVLAGLASLQSREDTLPKGAAELPQFDLQGHRGARGLAPENSLPGVEAALATGVTTLELDLVVTADDVLVAHHDLRLNPDIARGPDGRWLSGPGPAIIDLTLEEVQRYDIGRLRPLSRLAARFPQQQPHDGTKVPTLEQILTLAETRSDGRIRYNLETKLSPLDAHASAPPAHFAELLVATLRRKGVADRAMVQSFDWRTLQVVQELAPEIPTAYLSVSQSWLDNLSPGPDGHSPWTAGLAHAVSLPAAIAAAGGAVWSPYWRELRPGDLSEAHALGLKVIVWTVNQQSDMERLVNSGVDGIITDYPDRLRDTLSALGRPLPQRYP